MLNQGHHFRDQELLQVLATAEQERQEYEKKRQENAAARGRMSARGHTRQTNSSE